MNDRLLPKWLQAVFLLLPVLLIVLFVGASYWQVKDVSDGIMARERADLSALWSAQPGDSALTSGEYASLVKWRALVAMEHEAIAQRYEQGGILAVSRITTKYLGFLTGMIMAIAGSIFIIGRIREEATRVSGEWQQAKVAVRSSSPGILFGLMGAALMGLAIVHHQGVTTQDSPLYLHPANTYLIQPTRPVLDEHSMRDLIGAHGGSSEGDPNVIPADSVPEP